MSWIRVCLQTMILLRVYITTIRQIYTICLLAPPNRCLEVKTHRGSIIIDMAYSLTIHTRIVPNCEESVTQGENSCVRVCVQLLARHLTNSRARAR